MRGSWAMDRLIFTQSLKVPSFHFTTWKGSPPGVALIRERPGVFDFFLGAFFLVDLFLDSFFDMAYSTGEIWGERDTTVIAPSGVSKYSRKWGI